MERQYVGIDLHRRSSTVYRMNAEGEMLGCVRIPSQPLELAEAMVEAGDEPEVVLESTYGWYWAADLLKDLGANVHLAHPLGNNWGNRRVKNDERDAKDLAAMLRLGRLAEGWIAPPEVRELRELVRYRFRLVGHARVPRPKSTGSWPRTESFRSEATCGARAGPPSSTRSSSQRPMRRVWTRFAT